MKFLPVFEPYVKEMRPVGSDGEHLGLCPFHEDNQPSFNANLESGMWLCRGCGAKGGPAKFLAAARGLDAREAQAEVARLTGQAPKPGPRKAARSGTRAGGQLSAIYDYRDEQGQLLFQVCRFKAKKFVQRRPNGKGGWVWNIEGVRRVLYRLPDLAEAALVVICEGERDAEALRKRGFIATTCPQGAGKWRTDYNASLQGKRVVILPDNDAPGRAHAEDVAKALQGIAAGVKVLELPGLPEKGDVSDWLAAGGTAEELLRLAAEAPEWKPQPETASPPARQESAESPLVATLRKVAELALESEREEAISKLARLHKVPRGALKRDMARLAVGQAKQVSPEDLAAELEKIRAAAGNLLGCPDILGKVVEAARGLGLAGEETAVRLLYLVLTSRLLERPVSLAIKGPSSAGKSFTLETVLRLLPPSAYYSLSAMSERALVYSEEPLSHRHLILYEAEAMADGFGAYIIRSLLSEGRLRYETVEKTESGQVQARLIEREGPTGLIFTTTRAAVHAENETRLLSLTVADDPEQTRRILRVQAQSDARPEIDLGPWHALQRCLEIGPRAVSIPFAGWLAERCDASAVRLRRDFPQVLSLIRAHALLHQEMRKRDEQGRILATPADYTAVHGLVSELLAEGIDAAVSPAVRVVVETVGRLSQEAGGKPVKVSAVAGALNLERSTCSYRLKRALKKGWVEDQRQHRNRPAELVLGDALPGNRGVLPDPAELQRNYPSEMTSRLHATQESSTPSVCSGVKTPTSRQLGVNSRQNGVNTPTSRQESLTPQGNGLSREGVNPVAGEHSATREADAWELEL